tara:strand:- start:91 stop:357 length:267 start_codon:yes stop_codon:yes gene_type:complete
MIDWSEAVEDYKTQYTDEDGIHEYVDSLVPIYYGDITQTFMDLRGPSISCKIHEAHVGMPVWRFMQEVIYEEYMGEFMAHWTGFDEEE